MNSIRTTDKTLFQVRLSDAEKRQIETLAASQGLTLQKAVVAAFAAWAEKLKAGDHRRGQVPAVKHGPIGPPPRNWLNRAAELDWTRCPEVEVAAGKTGQQWVLRGTNAPLVEVLQSVSDGHPVEEVAQVFEVQLEQLNKVLQFAGTPIKVQ